MTEQSGVVKSSLNAVGFAFNYISENTLSKEEREQLAAKAKDAGEFIMDYALKQGKITSQDKKVSLINQAVARTKAAFEDAQKVNVYGDKLAKIQPPLFSRNGAPIPTVEKPTREDAIIGIANIAFALAWLTQKEGKADLETLGVLFGINRAIKDVVQSGAFGRREQSRVRNLIKATDALAVKQGEADVGPYLREREQEMVAIGYRPRAKEVQGAVVAMKKIVNGAKVDEKG